MIHSFLFLTFGLAQSEIYYCFAFFAFFFLFFYWSNQELTITFEFKNEVSIRNTKWPLNHFLSFSWNLFQSFYKNYFWTFHKVYRKNESKNCTHVNFLYSSNFITGYFCRDTITKIKVPCHYASGHVWENINVTNVYVYIKSYLQSYNVRVNNFLK